MPSLSIISGLLLLKTGTLLRLPGSDRTSCGIEITLPSAWANSSGDSTTCSAGNGSANGATTPVSGVVARERRENSESIGKRNLNVMGF